MAKFWITLSARFAAARALVQDLPIPIAHIGQVAGVGRNSLHCRPAPAGRQQARGRPTRTVAKGHARFSIEGL